MDTNKAEKCAHPACKCAVPEKSPYGNYCSAQCENEGQTADVKCTCGHPGCS